MLMNELRHKGIQVVHTHNFAARITQKELQHGIHSPVLYVFGAPFEVILSLRQMDFDTNNSWVR